MKKKKQNNTKQKEAPTQEQIEGAAGGFWGGWGGGYDSFGYDGGGYGYASMQCSSDPGDIYW